jgi:hypothetical protein
VGGVLQLLYMGVVEYSDNYSVAPRSAVCSREIYCEPAGFARSGPESVSVGARGEVCRRRSRAPAAESVRVRRKEAIIARAGPETVSVGTRGKRALNYHEAGSAERVDRGL